MALFTTFDIAASELKAQTTRLNMISSNIANAESTSTPELSTMVARTNQLQQRADQAVKQLHTGGEQSLHDAMFFMEKADISLRDMVQVRNNALDVNQEVMRMQV